MSKRWMSLLVTAAVGISLALAGGGVARAEHWQDRVSAGHTSATNRGTTIEIAWLDRFTGEYRDNGPAAHTRIESASVMKVFIAEHLLRRQDAGQIRLSPTDMADMGRMLRDSANAPANRFWSAYGANNIVRDVIARYGLHETGLTSNTRYWGNTLITAHDMVVFYRGLMDGVGGLSVGSRNWIVDQMRQSTMWGDGGRQFFGLRDGLPREQVIGQKQGWMCCVNGNIYRHTSGFTGPDGRFIVVVLTREPSGRGGAHIEQSITGAVRAMFPEGLVPRVQGHIGERWHRLGGAFGRLGYPISDEIRLRAGALSLFQGGNIYWSPGTGAHAVWGDILKAYHAHGWENGPLGYPTSSEIALRGGALSLFQNGNVYWSPRTGAHAVRGNTLKTYGALGWENGRLGYPISDEIRLRGGALSLFQGGNVYWSPQTGAHAVWGETLKVYHAHGWENGPLGYPTSNEIALRGGALTLFQGGNVYSSPRTGAHAVRGDLLAMYKAQGYELGSLGYPTSDAYRVDGGTRMDFQGGHLIAPDAPQAAAAGAIAPEPTRTPTAPPTGAAETLPTPPTTAPPADTPAPTPLGTAVPSAGNEGQEP
ncbi:serine hydrolase [Blastococcus sp. LR1]|uniref:serine hydrolase n=1 Tax=Blastococcus sp. LR1 TaxID=2877000 RepID=UPI001CCE5C53|nr:serine hydrolase [Blastococcus sp. LR1]MCA0146205.1 hypothetical protein [Blastococcus sp. LR1]